jgi:hypothetical protein
MGPCLRKYLYRGGSLDKKLAAARSVSGPAVLAALSAMLSTVLCMASAPVGALRADEARQQYDGEWDTILSCPNFGSALGYSFEFVTIIKHGVLHGEKGTKGEPGWLQLDGSIPADGRASIYASGLVGASEAAVGHRPAGTQYGYHIEVEFTQDSGQTPRQISGRGRRIEGRPCTVTFTKGISK